jgi:hypothetical protein
LSSCLPRDARYFISREVTRRSESPRTADERPNAEPEGLIVGEPLHATFSRADRLHAITADTNVRVLGAGTARGVEREHRELAVRLFSCGGSGASGSVIETKETRGGLLRTDAGVHADRRCCR